MPEQLLDFTGQVVLVTGGATGIGRATCLAFARQGAPVVIGDVDGRAAQTVGLIEEAGGTGRFVRSDVTVVADVENLVRRTVDEFGGCTWRSTTPACCHPPGRCSSRPRRTSTGPSQSTSRASSSP